jgi:G3E family GTPase
LASHDVSTAFVIDAVVCVVNAKHVKQHLDEVKPDGALVR